MQLPLAAESAVLAVRGAVPVLRAARGPRTCVHRDREFFGERQYPLVRRDCPAASVCWLLNRSRFFRVLDFRTINGHLALVPFCLPHSCTVVNRSPPQAAAGRLVSLDLIRGLAILGMLWVNLPWRAGDSMSRVALALAHVAALVAQSQRPARWMQPVSAVGRTALTNYLAHSLICFAIFHLAKEPWNTWDQTQQFQLVVLVWTAELALSVAWLQRYPMGPLEWSWRRLADGRAATRWLANTTRPPAEPPPAMKLVRELVRAIATLSVSVSSGL